MQTHTWLIYQYFTSEKTDPSRVGNGNGPKGFKIKKLASKVVRKIYVNYCQSKYLGVTAGEDRLGYKNIRD